MNIDNNFLIAWFIIFTLQNFSLIRPISQIPRPHFLNLHLSISDGTVKSKIYDKHDDLDFVKLNVLFLDGDVPCSTSYDVYISEVIRFG